MEWAIASFRENLHLDQHDSLKIFLFILKSMSGIAFIFVLGYLAAGGSMNAMVWIVLLFGAVIDLVPEYLSIRALHWLNPTARRTEQLQLVLAALAYMILAGLLYVDPAQPFYWYAVFCVVWIFSFLVQQATFVLWNREQP